MGPEYGLVPPDSDVLGLPALISVVKILTCDCEKVRFVRWLRSSQKNLQGMCCVQKGGTSPQLCPVNEGVTCHRCYQQVHYQEWCENELVGFRWDDASNHNESSDETTSLPAYEPREDLNQNLPTLNATLRFGSLTISSRRLPEKNWDTEEVRGRIRQLA